MSRILYRLATLVVVTLATCACTSLKQPPICGEFEGLKSAIQRKSTVSVFIVHGMGGFSQGDPCDLIKGIAKELCLRPAGPMCRHLIESDDPYRFYGCLTRHDFCGTRCPANVRFYVLDWSPTTLPEKSSLRCIDQDILSIQVWLTTKLKKDFINNSMADVALYLGPFGTQMRYPLQQSLRWIYEESRDLAHHEMVMIGFSMGGQMILDTLDDMRDSPMGPVDPYTNQVRESLIRETSAFFMLSNQLPLLELAKAEPKRRLMAFDQNPPRCQQGHPPCFTHSCVDPNCLDWDRTTLGEFLLEKRATDRCFQIVSVSDPDDLLSYPCFNPMIPHCQEGSLPAFAMLGVREARYAILGMFVNPAAAHQNYGENPVVIHYVAHGRFYCCHCCRPKPAPTPCCVEQTDVETPCCVGETEIPETIETAEITSTTEAIE